MEESNTTQNKTEKLRTSTVSLSNPQGPLEVRTIRSVPDTSQRSEIRRLGRAVYPRSCTTLEL